MYTGIDEVAWEVDVVGVDICSVMVDISDLDFVLWVIDDSGYSLAAVVIMLVYLEVLIVLKVV